MGPGGNFVAQAGGGVLEQFLGHLYSTRLFACQPPSPNVNQELSQKAEAWRECGPWLRVGL